MNLWNKHGWLVKVSLIFISVFMDWIIHTKEDSTMVFYNWVTSIRLLLQNLCFLLQVVDFKLENRFARLSPIFTSKLGLQVGTFEQW